jgi:serine/threonine protein phosphatase PrpC
MTRSFGDKVGAQAGVIAVPEILEFTVTKHDRFVVIASDGVWEYLTNEEVRTVP